MDTVCSKYIWTLSDKINKNLVNPENGYGEDVKRGFLKKHIVARLGYLGLIPLHAISGALDTIMGLGTSCVSLIKFGKKPVFEFAHVHLYALNLLPSTIFLDILRILKPDVELPNHFSKVSLDGNGLITDKVFLEMMYFVEDCKKNGSNVVMRQIVPRLTYALLAVACVITRVVDLALGLIALPFSLLIAATNINCLNKKASWIHGTAFRGLQITGIVCDLFLCVSRIFNINAGM